MKQIITFVLVFLAASTINAQGVLKVTAGATLKTTGGVAITLQNMDLDNDGTIAQAAGDGSFRITGTQNSAIKGTNMPVISILEVAKTNNSKLVLNRNINIGSSINFISGQLELNNNNVLMNTTANIAGESENNRIIGANGGFVEITQNMNAPASVNAGNLGATITSAANLGSVTIRRGHTVQSGTGLTGSVQRYYSIESTNNSSLNATLRIKYFDGELNGQNENALELYKSNDNGINWSNMLQTTRNINANYVEKTGLTNLALQTLGSDAAAAPGVTGLLFTGQRKKATDVTLKWTTQTETSMSGYQVQRRLKNEINYSDRSIVNTLAQGGNSSSQLSYQNVDANSYTDTSYYRLKIVATDNTFSYSNVIAVAAKTSGSGGGGNPHNNTVTTSTTMADGKTNTTYAKITVGPNPNFGNFWFTVNGLAKETPAALYTIDGKLIKQFRVVNMQQQPVNDLSAGIYILKVPGYDATKIIVQGNGRKGSTNGPATSANNKLD